MRISELKVGPVAGLSLAVVALFLFGSRAVPAPSAPHGATHRVIDLLAAGRDVWQSPDPSRWTFREGRLYGTTKQFLPGPTDEPNASSFLVSRKTYAGDQALSMDLVFSRGRYLGVFLDYDPKTQTGMWLATGHGVVNDPKEENPTMPMAYIKTVENGVWIVRAMGQLDVVPNELLKLRFVKHGREYSIFNGDRVLVTYRSEKSYPPGPLQFRLMNSVVEFRRLQLELGGGR